MSKKNTFSLCFTFPLTQDMLPKYSRIAPLGHKRDGTSGRRKKRIWTKNTTLMDKNTTPMDKKMTLMYKKDDALQKKDDSNVIFILSSGLIFFYPQGSSFGPQASSFCWCSLCFCPWVSYFCPEVASCLCPGGTIFLWFRSLP